MAFQRHRRGHGLLTPLALAAAFSCFSPTGHAQSTWVNVTPLSSPPARTDHAMAFDSHRRRTVLFSGSGATADTWEWDGMLWVKKIPATSPPARARAGTAYDAKRRKVVLFGGQDTARFGDTWEWDGIAWIKKSPNNSPSPRVGPAMAYDSDREVIVLFGGNDGSDRDDTWEWDGQNWKQLSPVSNPPAQSGGSMVYDSVRKRMVLIPRDNELWELAGGVWTKKAVGQGLLPGYAVVFDGLREHEIAFGGRVYPDNHTAAAFEWDGSTWGHFPTRIRPPARELAKLVYDSARRRVVMFGGQDRGGKFRDTWELVHDCRCVALGHPDGGLPLTCVSAPLIGRTLRVAFPSSQKLGYLLFGGTTSTTPWLHLNQPFVCRPGTVQFQPFRIAPGFGDPIVFDFAIPNDLRLENTRLSLQGVSLEIGCFLLTDAIEVTLRGF